MDFDVTGFRRTPDKRSVLKTPGKSKFEKQREEDVVRNAHERGYLKAATEDAIWENIGEKCDLTDIKYLHMSSIHLHTVRSLDLCRLLRVCVLSCNYITSFEALGQCRQLLFLDLHDNQITKIPGHRFWVGLEQLQAVYLHNNGISKLGHIQYMSSSSSLSILTLFDTPLSLNPNYRHHVVNSIWTLKALDNYVISDEEIIEDASFGSRFAAKHPKFSVDFYKAQRKERNFEEAVKKVYELIAQVNSIQAKYSPVLIIQRHIRGHLARQKVKYLQDMRIWAAVSIQRFYRHYKGHGEPLPPPSSPAPSRSSSALTNLDYDSYVKGLKAGYTATLTPRTSEEKLKARGSNKSVSIIVEPIEKIDEEFSENTVTPRTPPGEKLKETENFPVRITTKVNINLRRLETSTSDIIKAKEEAVTIKKVGLEVTHQKSRESVSLINRVVSSKSKDKSKPEITKSRELLKVEEKLKDRENRRLTNDERVGRYHTVKMFFGPLTETYKEKDKDSPETERDPKRIEFRLSGLEPPITTSDPLLNLLSSKREAGEMVRQAAREHDIKVLNEIPKRVTRRPIITTDQRLFIRTHGTMGMACLRAVQQAYKDRERSERSSGKSEKVAHMREEREEAKSRVRMFKNSYQDATLRRRIREGVKTAEALKEREARRMEKNERLHTARTVTAEHRKSRQADSAFINDFSCQQTSVSNALMKHDRATHREETLNDVNELVRKGKDADIVQQGLVRRYMEHRQLLRQAETAMARVKLDARLHQEMNQRNDDVKTRLTHIKTRNQQRKEHYSVPYTLAPPQLPPLGVVAQDQMQVWETLPKVDWQPRSHERTQSEPMKRIKTHNRQRLYTYQPSYAIA